MKLDRILCHRWEGVVEDIINDEFAELVDPDNAEIIGSVMLHALDATLPTFNTLLNVSKIQKAWKKWLTLRRNAVSHGKKLYRGFDSEGSATFTVEGEQDPV